MLHNLISEGPAHGIHVIATCDTYNNVTRFLGRKTLSEFEMRVLFQMSASDSASLIEIAGRQHARPASRAFLQRPGRLHGNFPSLCAARQRMD